jgi:hypothetical protein
LNKYCLFKSILRLREEKKGKKEKKQIRSTEIDKEAMEVVIKSPITNRSATVRVNEGDSLVSLASQLKQKVDLNEDTPVVFLQGNRWISHGKLTFGEIKKQSKENGQQLVIRLIDKKQFFNSETERLVKIVPSVSRRVPQATISGGIGSGIQRLERLRYSVGSSIGIEMMKETFIASQFDNRIKELDDYYKRSNERTNRFGKGIIQRNQNVEYKKSPNPFKYNTN